jgi:hypothetical protein
MEPSKGKIKDGYGRVGRKKAACFFISVFHVIRQSQIRSGGQYEKSDFDGELWDKPPGYTGKNNRSHRKGACGSIFGPDALPGVYKRHGHRKIKVGP